ncbi:hypothetical protein LN996_20700 [Arthrobacter sp. AK01]|uniref:hypothetical protein n=1 Tax=Arthrobacter sp. AK01 TaxID=2894084 RepID=UPI001E5C7AFE|nr:hypothetical protein [Arthrobacter sp. AK01]MCD4853246.1 hypothetical protein [Arthrobacter sp. AK01]
MDGCHRPETEGLGVFPERLDTISDFEISLLISAGGDLPIFIRTFQKGADHLRDRDHVTGINKF